MKDKTGTKCLFSVQAEEPLGKRFAFSFLGVMSDLRFSTTEKFLNGSGNDQDTKEKIKKKNIGYNQETMIDLISTKC